MQGPIVFLLLAFAAGKLAPVQATSVRVLTLMMDTRLCEGTAGRSREQGLTPTTQEQSGNHFPS